MDRNYDEVKQDIEDQMTLINIWNERYKEKGGLSDFEHRDLIGCEDAFKRTFQCLTTEIRPYARSGESEALKLLSEYDVKMNRLSVKIDAEIAVRDVECDLGKRLGPFDDH